MHSSTVRAVEEKLVKDSGSVGDSQILEIDWKILNGLAGMPVQNLVKDTGSGANFPTAGQAVRK